MTSLALDAPHAARESQAPRISWVPPFVSSAGDEAIELAALAGLELDPWEALVLASSLNERADGKWSAFEVGLNCPRQNGKGSILEARELAGLFLLAERRIVHSAHLFKTALDHFNRLMTLIESTPDFDAQVAKVSRAHGEEGITLRSGQSINFATRTKSGGRGLTGDLVVLDEAFEIPEAAIDSLFPTMAARSIAHNPQIWYTGTAVDQEVHESGVVFARIRERGMAEDDPRLQYMEWSVDPEEYAIHPEMIDDPEAWGRANPALGVRISQEYVESERRALSERGFARERLGVGDWPATDGSARVIPSEKWDASADPASEIDPKSLLAFAFDVSPDRARASVAVAGKRTDGLDHIEIIRRGRGTGWVLDVVKELLAENRRSKLVCDGTAAANSLLSLMEAVKIEVEPVTTTEHAAACGNFYDGVDQNTLRHLADPALSVAVAGAVKRKLSDKWAWSRSDSSVDITPLVAATLALGKLQSMRNVVPSVINPEAFGDDDGADLADSELPPL